MVGVFVFLLGSATSVVVWWWRKCLCSFEGEVKALTALARQRGEVK